jgi:NNP family nitrate/nitrite transporter-like MFS transporter
MYVCAAAMLFAVSFGPASRWLALGLFVVAMLALGMGNGAVFQLIPLRFRHEIGLMTGMVGCAGGIGGFFLAKALGIAKAMTGGFGAGFVFFGLLALLGFLGLAMVKVRWRTTWGAASGARV